MYKLKDRWTTRDGIVTPDRRTWGMPVDMYQKYKDVLPPDKGCAICILVRLEGGLARSVFFETVAGYHESHEIDAQGWAHTTMYNPGSGYGIDTGKGPWSVQAEGIPSEIVDGIGLPNGEHVSTWVVLEWVEGATVGDGDDDSGPTPVEPPTGYVPHIQVLVDGAMVYEFGGS